ncbi:MAG TPA: GNAT family N-acetyltransferase [Bryobacteraceae bacterium]|jgi:GNAT superfamily N-acetyltransferase|nr:GNAT family N-acetyltransferase [Bryobacteraceae bacterium]
MLTESLPKIEDAIQIREIAATDAEAAAQLCAELGYPVEAEPMRERIDELSDAKGRVVYVACVSNMVIGWIEVSIVRHLSSGASGEIGGFIVSSGYRGGGIGRQLIAQAEQWVAYKGAAKMVVRSRITREAAHRFYFREGYSITKTSAVFSKQLKA